jgi:hypothetical protein
MVRLMGGGEFRRRHLVLRFPRSGLRAYAFTFDTCVRA